MQGQSLSSTWQQCEEEARGDIRTMREFENGYRIVRLLSIDAAIREGTAMQHCLKNILRNKPGDGGPNKDYATALLNHEYNPAYNLYSLRSPENKAKTTFVITRANVLIEHRGRQNQPPKSKYAQNYTIPFFIENGVGISPNAGQTGLIYQDDAFYEIMHLPDNFHCKGNYDISYNQNLRPPVLPRMIDGYLDISNTQVVTLNDVDWVGGQIFVPSIAQIMNPLSAGHLAIDLDDARLHMRKFAFHKKLAENPGYRPYSSQ